MDYMEKITELRASKAKLNKQAQALVTEGKFEDANKLADLICLMRSWLDSNQKS